MDTIIFKSKLSNLLNFSVTELPKLYGNLTWLSNLDKVQVTAKNK